MSFRTKLRVEYVDGHNWLLCEDLVYVSPTTGSTYVAPAGFLTDFASIPRPFRSVVGDAAGPWAPAAVMHDYLYRTGLVTRSEADLIFREAMSGYVRTSKRWAMWAAVRAFGWLARRPHGPSS